MKTVKELYIFRHAEKDISSDGDPSLSIRGTKQAENIANSIEQKILPRPDKLWVSPKRRAKETFEPTQQITQLTLNIDPELDQRNYRESSKEFFSRVRQFIEQKLMLCQEETIFICTHSDWIEALSDIAPIKSTIDFNEFILPSAYYLHFRINRDLKNNLNTEDTYWSYVSRGV